MKLLMFYTKEFWLRPATKSVPAAEDREGTIQRQSAILVWIHAEPSDRSLSGKIVTKAIKNIKWLAGKFETRVVVLHYFAHLAKESAPALDAQFLVETMAERLDQAGYQSTVTPFGYFTEFRMHVAGDSLAKVFVDLGADEAPPSTSRD
jgi:hypothetical protein